MPGGPRPRTLDAKQPQTTEREFARAGGGQITSDFAQRAADTSVSAGIFAHDTEFISWSHLARSGAATGLQAPAAHASQVLRWWWTAREDLKALPALARIAQPRPTCGGMARGNDCAECNGAPPPSATKRRSAALALVCWAAPRCCKLSHAPTQTCHSKSLAAIPRRMHRISSASEVKRRRARFVLGWGTAREDLRVLPAFCIVCSR